jgi:hypothetical protein
MTWPSTYPAGTLGYMVDRIDDELAKSGTLNSQIQACINDAGLAYQADRWWFNESRDQCTWNTVVGQNFYGASANALIPDILAIDYLAVTVGTVTWLVQPERPEVIEHLTMSTINQGWPYLYCYYEQQIRLYPIPDQAYPMFVAGTFKAGLPASLSDTTPANVLFITQCERLIRCRAIFELATHYLRDFELAARYDPTNPASLTAEAYSQFKGRTNRQTGTGIIRATEF